MSVEVTAPDATVAAPEAGAGHARQPRRLQSTPSRVDKWFDRITLLSGVVVLLRLLLVGIFLLQRSRTALGESGIFNFLTRETWRTDIQPPEIGVLGLLTGTVIVAVIAVMIAIPLGVTSALF